MNPLALFLVALIVIVAGYFAGRYVALEYRPAVLREVIPEAGA